MGGRQTNWIATQAVRYRFLFRIITDSEGIPCQYIISSGKFENSSPPMQNPVRKMFKGLWVSLVGIDKFPADLADGSIRNQNLAGAISGAGAKWQNKPMAYMLSILKNARR